MAHCTIPRSQQSSLPQVSTLDQVLGQPVSLGGFVWSYGFLWKRLVEQGVSLEGQNLILSAALSRGVTPAEFDTREIPPADARRLWNAMEFNDAAVIDSIVRVHFSEVGRG